MPEGHVIARLARQLNQSFARRPVAVTSPQGRFAESAALLDGSVLLAAESYGKHLFVTFDAPLAEPVVHIHLGLIGRLQVREWAEPTNTVRMRISDGTLTADLTGPQWCRLISTAERETIKASHGPDPLRADAESERAQKLVTSSKRTVAALLLDQRVVAGAGNIYRAEVLFRQGIDPFREGQSLTAQQWQGLWNDLVELMAEGVRVGRIDTVRPQHSPQATGREPRQDPHGGEVYVYRRAAQPCLVCGQPVQVTNHLGRLLYWCARCQQ